MHELQERRTVHTDLAKTVQFSGFLVELARWLSGFAGHCTPTPYTSAKKPHTSVPPSRLTAERERYGQRLDLPFHPARKPLDGLIRIRSDKT